MESAVATGSRAYRSSHREGQARRTRQRMIAAATTIFLDGGYAAATMRAIAGGAGVSVPTVESTFGTKARVLKAAIDVAIVGDDEPVAALDRPWTEAALAASTAPELLAVVAGVLGPAQARSAGLVLAAFEGGGTNAELAELSAQLTAQRAVTAGWLVDRLAAVAPRRTELNREDAIDTVWIVMDPAVFARLTRNRGWTVERYEHWFAESITRLIVGAVTPIPTKVVVPNRPKPPARPGNRSMR